MEVYLYIQVCILFYILLRINTRMLIYLWNHYFNILDKYSEAGLLDHIFNFYIVKSYHTIFTVSA